MNVLGISCFYHDAAAALALDGQLVSAAQQERFSGRKHDPEFPEEAIACCLDRSNLTIDDIDCIAFYDKPLLKFDRLLTGYTAEPFRSFRAFLTAMPIWLRRKLWVEHIIRKELEFDGELLFVPHHLSHAAGSFYSSPFEQAAILTVDGVGEWATASFGQGEGTQIRLHSEMRYPHSVGLLYSAFTYYLGFQVNSSEYKIMGLAPYGIPRFADLIRDKLVTIHDDGSIHLSLKYFTFHRGLTMTGRKFARLFGRPRRDPESKLDGFHADVAASIQTVTEDILLAMARHVKAQTNQSALCLSGGVALNCKANGRLLAESGFSDIYVQPASGDAGGAVGAALCASYADREATRKEQPFFTLGPHCDDVELRALLDENDLPYEIADSRSQADRIGQALADGLIVGLFQGPMEFGPRALGFRSILADPRDAEMKERINRAVKYRESFRPFAPAVLEEKAPDYFDCDRPSPYMLFSFMVNQKMRESIPAVTHVDGSSRIQTVNRTDNAVLYDILKAFESKTGVPVVLNTSFNLRGHPIVNTPRQALATFCSSGIDLLALGSYFISKKEVSSEILNRFRIAHQPD